MTGIDFKKAPNFFILLSKYPFYAGIFWGTIFRIIVFHLLAFLIPKDGFLLAISHVMSKIFPGIIVFSQGSFAPGLSETLFTIGYLYILLSAIFFIFIGFYNLDKSGGCKKWVDAVNKSKNANIFYALLLFSFCELAIILANTKYFGSGFSFGVFTGYGLSVSEVSRSALAPYVSSLYINRFGLAFGGAFIIFTGWLSIVLVPLLYRAYRCVIISRKLRYKG